MLSMTGYGKAEFADDRFRVVVEIRSVNHRYLKVVLRGGDALFAVESRIEETVRRHVSRGTITVWVTVEATGETLAPRLNETAAEAYWHQLTALAERLRLPEPEDLTPLLSLPGVTELPEPDGTLYEQAWEAIEQALVRALEQLVAFRRREGAAMAAELKQLAERVRHQLRQVEARAPQVVEAYRDRLRERVRQLMEGTDVAVREEDLAREVSLFAERCDIHEEITRLTSHLDQFARLADQERSEGRKLDFLTQEMFREINTIGAKANDAQIAHAVVEMKSLVERMRELLQNVE